MRPFLSRTGIMLVALAATLVATGALTSSWPLLAIGFAQASAVLVLQLLFFPQATEVRRRRLELAWWADPGAGGAPVAGRQLTLNLMFRNRSRLDLTHVGLEVIRSSAILIDTGTIETSLPGLQEVRLQIPATPLAAGYWFFHGLRLRLTDRFGLFHIELYFPNHLGIKVFPPLALGRQRIPFRPRTGALHERAGRRILRQRGLGSDLRELRDHTPGDPFKRIAWKATARTGKLMVREFDSEIVATHWLLLDISPTMRAGAALGAAKLDYAIAICAALARQALDGGDRVGLLVFDTRIYTVVPPRDGHAQLLQIIDRLLELHNIVDEDLTDLTDAELHSAVANYLAYQEGVDVRVRPAPPRGSPQWNDLVLGADGIPIDADVMLRAVRQSLESKRSTGTPSWWSRVIASTPEAAQLRLFCRLCGVEIPYRRPSALAGKHLGMAQAIARAASSRASRFVMLISDLEEIGDEGAVLDALGLARRHHHSIAVIAPYAPAFFAPAADPHHTRIHNALALRHQRQRTTARMAIERLGVPVLSATPEDGVDRLLSQLGRTRPRNLPFRRAG